MNVLCNTIPEFRDKVWEKKISSGLTAGSLNVPWPTSKHEFIAQQQCVRIVCGFIHGYIT